MTYKEKIKKAIAHKDINFVPINIEYTAGFAKNMQLEIGKDFIDDDLCNHMLRKKYKKNEILENGDQIDLFGVTWQASKDGGDVGIVKTYPLQHCELNDYKFPNINEELVKQTLEVLENEKQRYTMFSITMGYFERAWSLCGIIITMCQNKFS